MAPLIATVLGLASGVGLWVALQDVLSVPALRRLNMAGRVVPVGGGIVLVLAVVLVAAGDSLASAIRTAPVSPIVPGPLLVAVLGFGFLGLLDDLLESGDTKGLRGHLTALSRGQLTTGAVKLGGGALVALLVAPLRLEAPLPWLLVDGALIALSANLGNLLDRAPGRLAKVALVLGAALVVGHLGSQASVGLAVVLGATAALLVPDLRAQVMLGDAGANVVDAALGWAFVTQASGPARSVALVVVAALNVVSERVSFSAVIASTPGLRTLDALGRRTRDRSDGSAGDDAA